MAAGAAAAGGGAARAPGDGSGIPVAGARLAPRCASAELDDGAAVHCQILPLSQQLYVWIGVNAAAMGQLYAAVRTPFDKLPSLSVLMGSSSDRPGAAIARRLGNSNARILILLGIVDLACASMSQPQEGAARETDPALSGARRLLHLPFPPAMKTGHSIVLSCNIPSNSPLLEAQAERLVLQELKSMGILTKTSSSSEDKGLGPCTAT
eukprot:SM000017S02870  [mRNA]  locus=s17:685656:686886:- [translate_table: standard]